MNLDKAIFEDLGPETNIEDWWGVLPGLAGIWGNLPYNEPIYSVVVNFISAIFDPMFLSLEDHLTNIFISDPAIL